MTPLNNLASTYSIPNGFLQIPDYRTNSGKSSIKYICSSTWNKFLKDLSMKNIEKHNQDPFWINKTNVKNLKRILRKYFLENYWAHMKSELLFLILKKEKNAYVSIFFLCLVIFISLNNFKIMISQTFKLYKQVEILSIRR